MNQLLELITKQNPQLSDKIHIWANLQMKLELAHDVLIVSIIATAFMIALTVYMFLITDKINKISTTVAVFLTIFSIIVAVIGYRLRNEQLTKVPEISLIMESFKR